MDKLAIPHQRLHNLRLTGHPFETPEEVLRWQVAVQSQDYPGGKWSIGQRVAGWTDSRLDRAFDEGRVLRTHVLRPTWHFVLPEDIRWLLDLTGPRVLATNAHYSRQFGVHDVLDDGRRVLNEALRHGAHLTRTELQSTLAAHGVRAQGLGLAYVLMYAELHGDICSGAMRGKQHTYALLDARAPNAPARLSRDEAVVELTRRYFASHGPATIKDAAWWSSLTVTDLKRGLSMLGSALECQTIDGQDYWFEPSSIDSTKTAAGVYLLQGYDEYFVGYSGASKALLDLSRAASARAQAAGAWTHVVVVNSQVVGRWQRTVTPREVRIHTELYRELEPSEHEGLQAAVDDYGRFLDLPATLD